MSVLENSLKFLKSECRMNAPFICLVRVLFSAEAVACYKGSRVLPKKFLEYLSTLPMLIRQRIIPLLLRTRDFRRSLACLSMSIPSKLTFRNLLCFKRLAVEWECFWEEDEHCPIKCQVIANEILSSWEDQMLPF